MTSVHFQGKPFSITLILVNVPTTNAEEAEVDWFYEDLPSRTNTKKKKRCPFIIGDWNAKVESRDTWSNRQVWPWSTN